MKKGIILLIVSVFFAVSLSQAQPKNKKLQEFVVDLSSVNIKLRGQLNLFGEFKGDLSNLGYERYLQLLKESENTSSKGVYEIIQKSDKHLFVTNKSSFLIAIYSKELNAVLYDDANTAFTDSIKVLNGVEPIPDLQEFISKTSYRENNN
jgi:hypothetical protein